MKRILVIEDETQVRENIQEILELSNYEVLVAENGKIGLELAQQSEPDLIICDIMMPELDGYEVLMGLRQRDVTATIPVIFLTAKADRGDFRKGMELGADDYITKPFQAQEILEAIASRFERQEAYNVKVKEALAKAENINQEAQSNQKVMELKEETIKNLIQDLVNPISNINMAINMLRKASTDEQKERYLKVLQQECAKEIKLLNEMTNLQEFLSKENASILKTSYLLKH
jgi:two-component system, OmpR family, alkaline phosphatase synthesis response regulator PhoP